MFPAQSYKSYQINELQPFESQQFYNSIPKVCQSPQLQSEVIRMRKEVEDSNNTAFDSKKNPELVLEKVQNQFRATLTDLEYKILESLIFNYLADGKTPIDYIKRIKTKSWKKILMPLITEKVKYLEATKDLNYLVDSCW